MFHSFPGASTTGASAGAKRKREPKKRTKQLRKHVAEQCRALDSQVSEMIGQGLDSFNGHDDLQQYPHVPHDGRLLVLSLDEGSVGYAGMWWLLYHHRLRLVFLRDPFHRSWNDVCVALKECRLWSVVLLTSVVYNINYGPWDGSAWWHKLCQGAQAYWERATSSDMLFGAFYTSICRDQGKVDDGSHEERARLFHNLRDAHLFGAKGPRVALRRWFSWMSAHAWHDPWWHLRLLMISAIGVFLRLWPVANAMPWLRPFARKCHKLEDSTEAAAEADAASKGIATLASASASDLIASTAAHAARMPLPRRQTTPMCYSLAVFSCRLKTFDNKNAQRQGVVLSCVVLLVCSNATVRRWQ